jgi:hypothetical protein
MRNRTLFVAMGLLLGGAFASAQGTDTATYSNVELISVDPASRLIIIRNAQGGRETLPMDDLLSGTGGVKAGDYVIVTVRGGAGMRRVSAIARTSSPQARVVTTAPAAAPAGVVVLTPGTARPVVVTADQVAMRRTFAAQVSSLSQDARGVDSMWAAFVTACAVKPVSANDGREWFGLWDGRVQADYSAGQCRDQFNQIVAAGEVIKHGMAAAETVANKHLTPGEIRDIRKLSLMDWDGWMLPSPQKREP